jgi:hypothetical protein
MIAHRRRRRRISVESVSADGQLLVCRSGSKLYGEAGGAIEAPSRLSPAAIRLIELIVRDLAHFESEAVVRGTKKER